MTAFVEREEVIQPGPAEGLAALLGVPLPDFDAGEGLPILWHWLYMLDRPAQADLGRDGHPVRGTIPAPPEEGRRRMWAGGRVRTTGSLVCGETATRRTSVMSTTNKTGRSGRLTFVTVRHQVFQREAVIVDEQQDIVYRDARSTIAAGPEQPEEARRSDIERAGDWAIDISPTLLFRYSALTYNGHRIHYDREYAQQVEGYPGLVTHGPLQAIAMAEAARARTGDSPSGQDFDYRLVSPLFDHQGMIVRADVMDSDVSTSVRDTSGRTTARGILKST